MCTNNGQTTTGIVEQSGKKHCLLYRHCATQQKWFFLFIYFPFFSFSSFSFGLFLSHLVWHFQCAVQLHCMNSNNIIVVCHPLYIDGPCALYELKTLKQSHQTFKMISFKPIMAINLWMEYDRIALRTTKRACTMRFSFWLFSFVFLIFNNNNDKKYQKCGVVNLVKNAFE